MLNSFIFYRNLTERCQIKKNKIKSANMIIIANLLQCII